MPRTEGNKAEKSTANKIKIVISILTLLRGCQHRKTASRTFKDKHKKKKVKKKPKNFLFDWLH